MAQDSFEISCVGDGVLMDRRIGVDGLDVSDELDTVTMSSNLTGVTFDDITVSASDWTINGDDYVAGHAFSFTLLAAEVEDADISEARSGYIYYHYVTTGGTELEWQVPLQVYGRLSRGTG